MAFWLLELVQTDNVSTADFKTTWNEGFFWLFEISSNVYWNNLSSGCTAKKITSGIAFPLLRIMTCKTFLSLKIVEKNDKNVEKIMS